MLLYAQGQGCVWQRPGWSAIYSGRPAALFNVLMPTNPVSQAQEAVAALSWANTHYRSQAAGWCLWLLEEFLPPALASRFQDFAALHALQLQHRILGMSAQQLNPPRRALPLLDFASTRHPAVRRDYCFVTAQAFQTELPLYEAAYLPDAYWSSGVEGYVGYHQGRAVAAASTLQTPGALGLYALAVLPALQGRGFGEATLRHALAPASVADQARCLVLCASSNAAPLYRRLGFAAISRLRIYSTHPC
jgi:ribosomal protein S18 acetylase RimI-like enzyme